MISRCTQCELEGTHLVRIKVTILLPSPLPRLVILVLIRVRLRLVQRVIGLRLGRLLPTPRDLKVRVFLEAGFQKIA